MVERKEETNFPAVTPNTALIRVNPGADEIVLKFAREAKELLGWAQARTIDSLDSAKTATNDLSIIGRLGKSLEDLRKEYVGPPGKLVKDINGHFKTITIPLSQARQLTEDKILAFRHQQEAERARAEEINRKRIELAEMEAKQNGTEVAPPEAVAVPDGPAGMIRSDIANVGIAKNKKWRMLDLDLLPREYMIPDTIKINRLVRNGIPSIPGIEIYIEEGIRTYQKK